MVSNSLSARRGPLRRPKTCHSKINPGRCDPPDPPPEMACTLIVDPDDEPIYVSEEAQFIWSACSQNFPHALMLTPICVAVLGTIEDVESGENCTTGNNITYTAPDAPGLETIFFIVIWPDFGTCSQVMSFPVTEEP